MKNNINSQHTFNGKCISFLCIRNTFKCIPAYVGMGDMKYIIFQVREHEAPNVENRKAFLELFDIRFRLGPKSDVKRPRH